MFHALERPFINVIKRWTQTFHENIKMLATGSQYKSYIWEKKFLSIMCANKKGKQNIHFSKRLYVNMKRHFY